MKTDRLLALLSILSETDRITVRELSSRLEVSRRTIFRDLESLGCAGIPVFSYIGPGGGVSILDSYKLKYKVLSADDKEKIFTALRGLRSIDNDSSITHLIAKLVPEQESAVFSQSDCVIDLSSWFNNSIIHEKISFLRSAVHARSLVRMEYISSSSRSIRIIEPHKLVFKQYRGFLRPFPFPRTTEQTSVIRKADPPLTQNPRHLPSRCCLSTTYQTNSN